MGTKMLHESFSLCSYPMRDFNWPLVFEGMPNNFSSWTPQITHDECTRKSFRQTILKHEEIFRKQVYELHRIYRVQQTCMEELKKKEEYFPPTKVHSSEVVSGLTERLGLWNGFPLTNFDRHGKAPPNIDHSSTHFYDQNGSRTGEIASLNSVNRSPRKVFDLHLPADTYLDDEDDDDDDYDHGAMHEINIVAVKDIQKDQGRRILVDLNEPVEECDGDSEISSTVNEICHHDLQDHDKIPSTIDDVHSRSSSSSSQPKSTLESVVTDSFRSSFKVIRDMDLNLEPSCLPQSVADEKDENQNSDLISNPSFNPESSDQSGNKILGFDRGVKAEILAAETILQFSLSPRTDALLWFAEAVTSVDEDLEASAMDAFEQEALNLESVEIRQVPFERERWNPSSEEIGSPDSLSKRSRRRRRDFQREILPGLATLSRQEVSEDIQILAAMARVAGSPWKKSGRGRRKISAEEKVVAEEKEMRREIIRWGRTRTTRRCCKQRSSSCSVASELVVAMDC